MTSPSWTLLPAPTAPSLLPTPQQAAVARPVRGVVVGRGAPGTGKSFCVEEAVLRRVEEGSELSRLIVLANSRAAAQRMRRQIVRRLPRAQVSPQVTTIHGLALGLLRRYRDESQPDWRLLRAPEQELRIRDLLDGAAQEIWPESVREALGTRAFARQLREVLARARHLSLDPGEVIAAAEERDDRLFVAVGQFFAEYLTVGDLEGALDYAELVYRARVLLTDPGVAASVRASFDAVIVDDVQEMDPAQVALLGDLAGVGLPLTALGDPLQRVSAFRGASPTALADLAGLPGAQVVDLVDGFRSRRAPAEALAAVRRRLNAVFAPPAPGVVAGESRVRAIVYDDASAELAHVAQQLRQAHAEGVPWPRLAVIARAGRSQLSVVARELGRLGVPVEVSGDEIVLADELSVITVLRALRVAAHGARPGPEDCRLLLSSALGGLDGVRLRRLGLRLKARYPDGGTSLQLLGRCLAQPGLLDGDDSDEATSVRELARLLGACAELLSKGAEVQDALWCLWDGTAWPERLRAEALSGSRRAHRDLDAMVELFELAARRAQLRGAAGAFTFATEVSGEEIPADTGRELELGETGVSLVTAHRAKSLEWERVWVVGVQERSWPGRVRGGLLLDPDRLDAWEPDTRTNRLQQERQLFYVACSRASAQLTVSGYEDPEGDGGMPSRFLGELGVELERRHGRPRRTLSSAGLIGELRAAVSDASASQGVRRAAALALAQLGRPGAPRSFEAAAPDRWWGVRHPSSEAWEVTEPIALSGSSLEALLSCPRRWFLSRRAGAERGRASRASLGDVMHLLAQYAVTEGLTAEQMHDKLDQIWGGLVFEAEYLAHSERLEIDRAVERFAVWHERNPHRVLGVEQPFQVRLTVQNRQVLLHGVVDRLELDQDGRLRVVDFKTGAGKPSDRNLTGMIQLGVYQLAAGLGAFDELAPGVREVAPPILVLLRHGAAEPLCYQQASLDESPALPGEELAVGPTWVHDRIAQALRIMESGAFDATECEACRYCAFASSCPAKIGARGAVR
ncbi:MAG TPA: ATP-dependent DNA helicase [Arachnia sp.]|nr:ATP-dependent DNA helicase [Arachnia sp.]HMT87246.1 ATP-dependent DNA helicase [Arachnia sp.]